MSRRGHGDEGYLSAPKIGTSEWDRTRIIYSPSVDAFIRDWYSHGAKRFDAGHGIGYSAHWFGVPSGTTLRDMQDMPFRADREALNAIEEMRGAVAAQIPAPVDRRRKPRWSEDSGDEMDIDRLRSGAPYWRETARMNASGPAQITLVSQVGAACNARARDLLWAPAATLAIADALEGAGYRVRILAGYHGNRCWQRSGDHLTVMVEVKGYGDPMSLQTLSATATAWFFRHHILACFDALGKPSGGYGGVGTLTKARALDAIGEQDTGAFHVIQRPAYPSRDQAIEDARTLLRGMFPQEIRA